MTGCVGLHEPVPHLLCAGLVLRESGGEAGAPPARADAPGPRQPKRELLRQVSTRDAPGPRQPQHELLRQVSTGDAPGPRQPCQVSTRDSSVLVTGVLRCRHFFGRLRHRLQLRKSKVLETNPATIKLGRLRHRLQLKAKKGGSRRLRLRLQFQFQTLTFVIVSSEKVYYSYSFFVMFVCTV